MPVYWVAKEEVRAYKTIYSVEADSAEVAEDLVDEGEGKEIDDEYIEMVGSSTLYVNEVT